jgi:ubiquinone/menaquinone biosynthesis C-methylase UbiE
MNPDDPSEAVERKQSVAGVFHRASPTYGHVGPSFFSHFGRKLVGHAALPRGAHVLDAASGRGAVLFPAAESVGLNGFVTGIDFAEGMVQETGREIIQRGLTNAEIRQMDAEHLDFPDCSFDAILCGFALFFFPQLERAMAEFRRVLQPGGRIAVSTWGDQFDKEWEWFDNLMKKHLPPQPETDRQPAPSDGPSFDTSAGTEKIFNTAGFTDIRVISEVAEFTYTTSEEWWEELWSHGGRAPLERIEKTGGPEELEKFKAECMEQLAERKGTRDFQQSFHVLYTLAVKPS